MRCVGARDALRLSGGVCLLPCIDVSTGVKSTIDGRERALYSNLAHDQTSFPRFILPTCRLRQLSTIYIGEGVTLGDREGQDELVPAPSEQSATSAARWS